MRNPYIAGSPITGHEMFFGREDVFTFVQQSLIGQHRDNVLVLYGQRRSGKTSVMYQMHNYLEPRYFCVFIDLHGFALEDLSGFLWELANHIVRVMRSDYHLDIPTLEHTSFQQDPRNVFEQVFLNQLWLAIGDRHILLMIDEAIRLEEQVQAGKLERDIFEYLRHLMQHYERLNFLFALGSGLEEMEKEYAFLFNVALYKKISFLDRQAAQALITQPVQDCYLVEPVTLEKMLQITSGHPYYTQLLCHCLFNHWQQSDKSNIEIDAQDVDAVLDEVVERGLAVLKHVWEESIPSEKAMMAGMSAILSKPGQVVTENQLRNIWAAHGVSLPKSEIANAMKSLIARDVILSRKGEADTYGFTVDLQRLWIQKYRRIEWVKEEIQDSIREWFASRHQIISRRVLLAGLAGMTVVGSFMWFTRLQWQPVFFPSAVKTATIVPTPSQPGLERSALRVHLVVEYNGLLNNSQSAAKDVINQIQTQTFLSGRRVGFVIVYAGAADDNHITEALELSQKVITILKTISNEGFNSATYYEPLFTLGSSSENVDVDIYLYI